MRNRRIAVVNWIMLISLVIAFATGILLKSMPGMWMGIVHGLSGIVLMISAMIHCIQHRMFTGKA